MIDPPWNETASPPVSRWAAIGGIALFLFIVCLVLDLVFREMMGGSPTATSPTALPAALATSAGARADVTVAAFTPVPFPTSTRIVTITPPRPRTSTPKAGARATPTPVRYKVKAGDTLGSIGKKYGVTAEALIKVNGLKSDSLSVGQTLIIPPK